MQEAQREFNRDAAFERANPDTLVGQPTGASGQPAPASSSAKAASSRGRTEAAEESDSLLSEPLSSADYGRSSNVSTAGTTAARRRPINLA